jgi:hypothetical protein
MLTVPRKALIAAVNKVYRTEGKISTKTSNGTIRRFIIKVFGFFGEYH